VAQADYVGQGNTARTAAGHAPAEDVPVDRLHLHAVDHVAGDVVEDDRRPVLLSEAAARADLEVVVCMVRIERAAGVADGRLDVSGEVPGAAPDPHPAR